MKRWRINELTAVVLAAAMMTAACGAKSSSGAGADGAKADVAAAKAFIAGYVGKPSPFPTSDKLHKRPKPGTKVVFVDSGTRIGELQWTLIQPAAKQLGIHLVRVKAGLDAEGVNSAMDSVVSLKPDGVLIAAVDPVLYTKQLNELRAQGATVVVSSVNHGSKYGLGPVTYGDTDVALAGSLLGAWTIARNNGKATNIALYSVPELAFSDPLVAAAAAKIKELCPGCKTRTVEIPVATLASGATQRVVSDIQAHPGTNAAIFSTDEIGIGLPSALKVAGLKLTTVGGAGSPANLQQIKDGTEDATLAVDLAGQMWNMVDQYARERSGQTLSGAQARGELVKQFLTKADITFDPNLGWTGYPDMAQRYAALWGTSAS